MASGLYVVHLAEAEHLVCVSVVEAPLLWLCPGPFELVAEHCPLEVVEKELHKVFVVYVAPTNA